MLASSRPWGAPTVFVLALSLAHCGTKQSTAVTCPDAAAITPGGSCSSAYDGVTCFGVYSGFHGHATYTPCECGEYTETNGGLPVRNDGGHLVWECMLGGEGGPPACPDASTIEQGTPCTWAYAAMTCSGSFEGCCGHAGYADCVCGGYANAQPGQVDPLPEAGAPLVWQCSAVSCHLCAPDAGSDAGTGSGGGG